MTFFKFENLLLKLEAFSKLLCPPAKVKEITMPIFLGIASVERNWEETFLLQITYY